MLSIFKCENGDNAIVALVLWGLQSELPLDCNAPRPQSHFQLSALFQGGNLQLQQDVMS